MLGAGGGAPPPRPPASPWHSHLLHITPTPNPPPASIHTHQLPMRAGTAATKVHVATKMLWSSFGSPLTPSTVTGRSVGPSSQSAHSGSVFASARSGSFMVLGCAIVS